ncbi:MAG TPA: hypothetical protein VIL42_01595 [Sphingomicrobium sp.]|jgi:hypothetical protein
MTEDREDTTDHPQTIDNEPLDEVRGGAMSSEQQDSRGGGDSSAQEVPSGEGEAGPADQVLSEGDAEAVRAQAQGGRTIGDSIHGGAGLDQGSGTAGDKGDLGGGDPQKVGGPSGGSARPGGGAG